VTEAGLALATLDPEDRRYVYHVLHRQTCPQGSLFWWRLMLEPRSLGEEGRKKKNDQGHKTVEPSKVAMGG